MAEEKILEKEMDPPKRQRNIFRTKECRVIEYNPVTKNLDVDFDGYGIRIPNAENITGGTVAVKYKGQIGEPNFSYRL